MPPVPTPLSFPHVVLTLAVVQYESFRYVRCCLSVSDRRGLAFLGHGLSERVLYVSGVDAHTQIEGGGVPWRAGRSNDKFPVVK